MVGAGLSRLHQFDESSEDEDAPAVTTARRRGRNRVRVRTPEEEEAEGGGLTRRRMARMPELRSEDSGSEAGRSSRSPRHKSSPRNRRLEMEAWAWPEGLEHWVLLAALAAAVCAAVPTEYHAPLLLPCLVVAVARSK